MTHATTPELILVKGLRGVGAELRAHGFSGQGVARLFALSPLALPYELLFVDATAPPSVLAELVELFVLGLPTTKSFLEATFTPGTLDALLASGLVVLAGERATTPFVVMPWLEFLLVCDRDYAGWDTVNVPNDSSFAVAQFVGPLKTDPSEIAVDLGTGCGLLALLATRHYRRVFAVDANPRAVAFARFNAALNGAELECHLGPELGLPGIEPTLPCDHADLVTFVMPFLYPELAPGILDVLFAASRTGDALVSDVYSRLPGWLSRSGRAVLWHMVGTERPGDAHAWFERVAPRAPLSIDAHQFRIDPAQPFHFVRALVTHGGVEGPHLRLGLGPDPTTPLAERAWEPPGRETHTARAPASEPEEAVVVISPSLARSLLDAFSAIEVSTRSESSRLTAREHAVLQHLASGYSYKTIARRQQIPARSVQTYAVAILEKARAL